MTKEAAQRSAVRRLALMKIAAPVNALQKRAQQQSMRDRIVGLGVAPTQVAVNAAAAPLTYFTHAPKGTSFRDWTRTYMDTARQDWRGARQTLDSVANSVRNAAKRGWQRSRQNDQNFVNTLAAPITYVTHAPRGTSFDDWKRAYWSTAKQDYRQYDDLRGLNADLGRAFRAGADRVAPPGAAGVPAGVVPPTAGIGRAIRGAGRYLNPRTYGDSPAARNLRNAYNSVQNAGRNTVNTVAAPATYPIYAPPGTSYPDWQRQYWQGAGQP